MNKLLVTLGVIAGIFFLILLIVFFSVVGVWNSLNAKNQLVQGGKSHYSAALNICTEKIKGVWEIANQYMDHESKTFQTTAEARSGYRAAAEAFEQAVKEGSDTKKLTQTGDEAVRAALAFRIQVEAYPQLRAVETANENIRNMQEATNEIKTALDDWITAIKGYNTYRGSAWPSIAGGFMGKFPSEIEYYEGEVQKLDVGSLNPKKSQ